MRTSRILASFGLSVVLLASSVASAADPAPSAKTGPAPSSPQAPAAKAVPDAPPKKSGPSGYGYSDAKPRRGAGTAVRSQHTSKTGANASFPAFSATEGGGSRIAVHLSAVVPVEEHKAAGSVTYILKGAHVRRGNDTNPLVTVHFNTPVLQARLVPHGADLHVVIDLRSEATPTFKMSPATQGTTAELEVAFPKGNYVTGDPAAGERALHAHKGHKAPATTANGDAPAPTPKGPKPPRAPKTAGPKL